MLLNLRRRKGMETRTEVQVAEITILNIMAGLEVDDMPAELN